MCPAPFHSGIALSGPAVIHGSGLRPHRVSLSPQTPALRGTQTVPAASDGTVGGCEWRGIGGFPARSAHRTPRRGARHKVAAGSDTVTVVPTPTLLATLTSPPCSSAMRL